MINLKTDKDNDQFIIITFLKMIHSLSSDVYGNNINKAFLNKIEVIKQYRKYVINSQNVYFFGSVIQKFQKLKLITMALAYETSQTFCLEMIMFNYVYEYLHYCPKKVLYAT